MMGGERDREISILTKVIIFSPLSFSKIFYFYFMYMGVLPVHCALGGQKKAPDPLELELQWAVGYCVAAGDGA